MEHLGMDTRLRLSVCAGAAEEHLVVLQKPEAESCDDLSPHRWSHRINTISCCLDALRTGVRRPEERGVVLQELSPRRLVVKPGCKEIGFRQISL